MAQNSFTPSAIGKIPSGYLINNIFTLNQSDIWATASSDDGTKTPMVLKSTDNGNHWQVYSPDTSIKGYALDLYVANSSVAYVILEDNSGNTYNYRSNDGGVHWKNTSFSYGVFVHAFSPANIVLVGAANAWYSSDSFSTNTNVPWSQGGPPSFTPFGFNQLSGTQCHFMNDSGLYFSYSKGSLVRTQNQGKKWKAFRTTLDSLSAASSIANTGHTFLALRRYLTGKGGLSRSTNDGYTWTNMSDSVPSSAGIQTISSIADRANYFMLGGYNAVMTSSDGGFSWKKTTLPSNVSSSGVVHLCSDTIAWLGGSIGGTFDAALYKIKLNPTKPGNIQKNEVVNFHVYPNPSNSLIYVDADSHGKVTLMNACGQLIFSNSIETLKNGIDLSHLPNGIYLLQFESVGQISNQKIVKTSY